MLMNQITCLALTLPLEISAYGSHKKRKCVIEYEY